MTQHIPYLARITGCGLLIALSIAGADAQTVDPNPTRTADPRQAGDAVVPKGAALARPLAAPHPRDTLTGDWGGLRTDLKDAGVSVRADYVSETFGVVHGGLRRGTAYTQQIRAGMDLDLDTLVGWSGAQVHVTLNDRRGIGISSDYVGNRLPIQEAYGGQYTRLSEMSYEQDFAGGKQVRRWFSVRPDVQYIIDPGAFGFRTTRNALAIGSQVKMQF